MVFDDLISRMDEGTVQALLGQSTVRLIMSLDINLASPSRLKDVLLELHGRDGLLLMPKARKLLVELLKPTEAALLCTLLEVPPNSDPYAALSSVSISRRSTRERALFDFFELPLPEIEEAELTPARRGQSTAYPLFAHQRRARREVSRLLTTEPRRVLLHMPTGSGKTRTAMHVLADHLRAHEPGLAVWLAHSEELCEQAATEFERAWEHLGDRELPVYRFWGARAFDPREARDGVVIAGLPKVYRTIQADLSFISRLSARCTLVVIDEAHQAIAETYRLILDTPVVQRPSTGLLGLSATPGRTWSDIAADQELADFFARQKVSLEVEGYANPVDYLVAEGYLARADFRPLLHRSGMVLSPKDKESLAAGFEIPNHVLDKLADDEVRNLRIVQEIETLVRRHARVIVFAISVEHARLLASVLRIRGTDAAAVSGETPQAVRASIIRRFREDSEQPQVICNYGVLTTGFDAPRTSAAVIARPTNSLVLYSQMVGRAIRGPKAGGNSSAEIVTVVDDELPGFGSIADAFRNWEDVWG